ncbi:MAG: hypothetical protein II317_02340 [Clostridia bacterium]|nr:hypothetical protein [Clostridia bacterium]
MSKSIFKRKFIMIVSAVLAAALISTVIIINPLKAKADVLLDKKNPTFDFLIYDGACYNVNYKCDPEKNVLVQDPEKGEYSITTNSYVMWHGNDHIALAYEKYKLSYGDSSIITLETTITERTLVEGSALHDNASVGLVIRGIGNDAPSVYLHCRSGYVGIVYRTKKGADTVLGATSGRQPIYPVSLRMKKQGNAVSCQYKYGNSDKWLTLNTVFVNTGDVIMAGVAAHSCLENSYTRNSWKDYSVVIEGPAGSTLEDPDATESGTASEEENLDEVLPPDSPVSDNILFRETFTDGSLTDGDESVTNPIWYTHDDEEAAKEAILELSEDKLNRYWRRRGTDDTYFFDGKKWTDYEYSIDLKYNIQDGATQEDIDNMCANENNVKIHTRFRAVDPYGFFGYAISLEYGRYVRIYKYAAQLYTNELNLVAEADVTQLGIDRFIDNEWHTWRIKTFDNTVTVYLDNREILTYADTKESGVINSFGGIGIGSSGTDISVDNLIVRKLTDLYGGDYDNQIAGNWDEDIPDYLKTWGGVY